MAEREQPIQANLHKVMNALASVIADTVEPNHFALLVFGTGPDGRANYISNASRETMVEAMMEFIARNDGKYVQRENVFHVLDRIEAFVKTSRAALAGGHTDVADAQLTEITKAIKDARDFHE